MSHRPLHARQGLVALLSAVLTASVLLLPCPPATGTAEAADDLQVEVAKKGLGKEVTIKKGLKEWFMLVEVTAENTVIVRQEIENGAYLVDESETHDRSMTKEEVDAAIEAFINSVKTQAAKRK